MGSITIQNFTTKNPITMIGMEAGVCWGADVSDEAKNYKRGLDCLNSQHGRTFEFPDVYLVIDGYSAKVIREWYTHIGGSPTRLQASTRYIDYEHGFDFVTPPSIRGNETANDIYSAAMSTISLAMQSLDQLNIPREDSSMLLPLGMETKIVCKHNLRNLIDMSHQRECRRAYHEYRDLFANLRLSLSGYSEEWKYIVDHYFMPKCKYLGYCPEKNKCPGVHRKED